ncbi:hypothetical protein [Halorussus caseinilyticus]|uniref:hypothetical protein n=1 Tax=Halorussus caseinilyticus TaxID=3034025 RepID=UPI0023E80F1A|nr:hypothetical protein [Halorussus sp. DT72]
MTDESGGSSPDRNPQSLSAHASAGVECSATLSRSFPVDTIRDRLEDNEYALSLILTSTRLETVISEAIRLHYGWDLEEFENEGYNSYSLGKLITECSKYGALQEHDEEINRIESNKNPIVNLRNNLVHDYGYLEKIEKDEETQKKVRNAIEDTLDFIEAVEL